MERKIRFVLVGSGSIAGTYVRALAELGNEAVLAGVVSRSAHLPEGAPAGLPVRPSIEAFRDECDAVVLCTPNGAHAEGAVEAAKLGKHVLSEKVLEISLERADRMIEACARADVRLGVSFQRRFSPDNMIVAEMLAQKLFGRVAGAELRCAFYRDDAYYARAPYRGNPELDGGGPFIQQAAHDIDLYLYLFGMPAEVRAFTGTILHDIRGEDHGAAIMRHPDGMIGSMIVSTCAYPGYPPALSVYTKKGSFTLENNRITTWNVRGIANPGSGCAADRHNSAASAAVTSADGHARVLEDFIDAIRTHREPKVSGRTARDATELILRIYAEGRKS